MKILGIIPARYSSSRFPGKPLIDIKGKSMIQRVYERSTVVLENVIVATDENKIAEEVKRFGGKAVMTSTMHKTGTDRCAEALNIYSNQTDKDFEIVINIQGDEPFIQKEHIEKVISNFNDKTTEISTLIKKITKNEDIFNPQIPKVIINIDNFAIYFSRSAIPFIRDYDKSEWHLRHCFYKHIGIYGYKASILQKLTKLKQTDLETTESLEQNRWIESGYKIKTAVTTKENIAIDTEKDLEKLLLNYSDDMET